MNHRSDGGSLEIEVSNFGPIVEAKIDLRPLTVFVGPSNTGKSYMAMLIYALHQHYNDTRQHLLRYGLPGLKRFQNDKLEKLPDEINDFFIELGRRLIHKNTNNMKDNYIILPQPVIDVIYAILKEKNHSLLFAIGRCIGSDDLRSLIRKESKESAHIAFRNTANDMNSIRCMLSIDVDGSIALTMLPDLTRPVVDLHWNPHLVNDLKDFAVQFDLLDDNQGKQKEFFIWGLLGQMAGSFESQLSSPLHCPAFFLPASRTGVMHAHRVVVSNLIKNAAMLGLPRAAGIQTLSGVVADFLQQLILLDRSSYRQGGSGRDFGTSIETAILGGSIEVDNVGAVDYPQFNYRPKGWKNALPLLNASSMVSELAPVVLYLRHVVASGDVLIIEEPEAHLHPAMQVEFTRQLATLVHSGVRVMVTTHSEWILEELANIVRRSELCAGGRTGNMDNKIALGQEQVGAWLFQPQSRPKGSVVKEIRLDESGLFPSGFDEVAMALHNDWADLANRTGEAT